MSIFEYPTRSQDASWVSISIQGTVCSGHRYNWYCVLSAALLTTSRLERRLPSRRTASRTLDFPDIVYAEPSELQHSMATCGCSLSSALRRFSCASSRPARPLVPGKPSRAGKRGPVNETPGSSRPRPKCPVCIVKGDRCSSLANQLVERNCCFSHLIQLLVCNTRALVAFVGALCRHEYFRDETFQFGQQVVSRYATQTRPLSF